MDELIKQSKGLISVESAWANRLIEMANRVEKQRTLYKLFCLPIFNVSKLYWYIYFKDNRN